MNETSVPPSPEVVEKHLKESMSAAATSVQELLDTVLDDKGLTDQQQFQVFLQAAVLGGACAHEFSALAEVFMAILRIRDLEAKLQGSK